MKVLIKSFCILLLLLLACLLLLHYQKISSFVKNTLFMQEQRKQVIVPIVIPTPTPVFYSVNSPDGSQRLIMKTIVGKNNTKSYAFSIADSSGNNQRLLFTNDASSTESMTIPNNSWSADSTYIYLEEDGKGWNDIFVLKASGDPFANGQKFLDVPTLFAQRKLQYTFKEVTGWASGTLLILYTTNADGTQGPSFWFDVTSQGFIQLAS